MKTVHCTYIHDDKDNDSDILLLASGTGPIPGMHAWIGVFGLALDWALD